MTMVPDETSDVVTIPAPTIQVEVLLALPERAWSVQLSLTDGATVAEALEEALPRLPQLPEAEWSYGIHGRLVTPATLLRNGDRIEFLRPLLADPMDQRRRRAAQR
jgi:putative ubiquitin-RnfH superfamily antitoxin RatB of RatAB toxin-antitoxin module